MFQKFIQTLKQINKQIDLQNQENAINLINLFMNENPSLFFNHPLFYYELISKKGEILSYTQQYEQSLSLYQKVLQFNPLHLLTLQRKIVLLQKLGKTTQATISQNIVKILSGLNNIENQKQNNTQSEQKCSIARIAQQNNCFSALKSIQRFQESSQRRKSVVFKNHIQSPLKQIQNKVNSFNQSEKTKAKKKSILKPRLSFDVKKQNSQNSQIEQNGQPIKQRKDQLTTLQMKLSRFDIKKVKSIEGKYCSKDNIPEIKQRKSIIFQVLDESYLNQEQSTKVQKKEKNFRRKSSLAEDPKFVKLSKQFDFQQQFEQ